MEHAAHGGYFCRIEMGYVQAGQTAAIIEHTIHVRYIGSVKILFSLYVRQVSTITKPVVT